MASRLYRTTRPLYLQVTGVLDRLGVARTGSPTTAMLIALYVSGLVLWADDLALRHAARSKGVPAFGTLDLVTDLVTAGQLPRSVLDEVVEAFRRVYVVDLPLAVEIAVGAEHPALAVLGGSECGHGERGGDAAVVLEVHDLKAGATHTAIERKRHHHRYLDGQAVC